MHQGPSQGAFFVATRCISNVCTQLRMPREAKTSFSAAGLSTPRKKFTKADGSMVDVFAIPMLPASPFRTVADDARHEIEYSYDVAIVRAGFDPSRPLPLDVEHATEFCGQDTRSRGWAHALVTAENEPDLGLAPGVLYGLFELNDLGFDALVNKHFGYTSAVSLGEPTGENSFRIDAVKSNALTNNPATRMPVAFSKAHSRGVFSSYTQHQNSFSAKQMEQLIALLGLQAGSDDAAVLAAVQALVDAAAASAAAADQVPAVDEALTAAMTALTAKVDGIATEFTEFKSKSAAFSASLTKQVTPTAAATTNAFGLTAAEQAAARKAGVSDAAFAKSKSTLAARGRAAA
ncbi:hypothetical protein HMPREF9702_00342 [Delftia acidovorans CCUG 15835]|nr:hypothetical protein HMPREF9702_00342 [Delftia acidovorans CCUG 15835]